MCVYVGLLQSALDGVLTGLWVGRGSRATGCLAAGPRGTCSELLACSPAVPSGAPATTRLSPRFEEPLSNEATPTQPSSVPPGHRVEQTVFGRLWRRRYSPFTTSVSVRFCCSPCSRIRASTVYSPASSSATSLITSELPSMWYLEHCSAARVPSFSLLSGAAAAAAWREIIIALECFKIEKQDLTWEQSWKVPILCQSRLLVSVEGICT